MLSRARTSLRLIPTESVSVALLEGERALAQGVVTNLSEAGARLLTNARVDSGRSVQIRFRTTRIYLLEAEARVVWSAEGIEPSTAMVGALHGVMFTELPRPYRERVRNFLASDAFPVGLPQLQAGEENLDNPFEEITDPDIERLVSVDPHGGNEFEEMLRELYPDLERLAAKFHQKAMTLGSNLRLQKIAPGPRRTGYLLPGSSPLRTRDDR